jgi:IS4 transposase
MLKLIIHPSRLLLNFILSLCLTLSKPQQKHLLRTVEALVVSEERKTLAGLYRQWVDAPDVSAVADFFRVSPWSAREMDVALSQFVMHDLIQRAETEGKTYTVYVSIDDSLTGKDKDTKSLETVDWHHDHDASTKKKATYCNGAVHISCRVQIGECSYTFAWRMYLREKTVRRLNRKRSKHQRVKFQTKYHLAREMLGELKPFIPKGWKVYVLFDNWYASAKLIKYIKRQGKSWHVLCAIKYNRTIDGIQVCVIDQNFRHKHYTKVEVKAADRTTTYYTRKVQGHLSDVPFPVCVIISRRHPRDKSPKYFLCTDLTLSAPTILNWYQRRWPIEVDYWYLKQRLGLGDFRLHSYEAIHRWYSVVYLTFSFLQWQLYAARASGQPLSSVADAIELKKAEHAREVLIAACKEAIACGEVEPVVERFINPLQMAA